MKLLVVGAGGREHALVWKLRRSSQVEHVWCAPGNGGISQDAECVTADVKDVAALADLAGRIQADLTVVGPELPLVLGVVDEFEKRGLRILGPSRPAARLEASKVFAKEFMARHRIPTASAYGVYDTPGDIYSALCAVEWPVAIKADGLCGGKGVQVAPTPDDATAFIERLMEKREFGEAGERVLLEEALVGEELSYIVLTDGERFLPMAPTRDHKRVFDGDRGPNTGGMGAYSTDGLVSPPLEKTIIETIVRPSLRGMASEGRPYRGFLYFGLMLTKEGPKVLEFNCRMGDPEAQPIVMRMDFDLVAAVEAALTGDLGRFDARWKPGASVCVVMASKGYPGDYEVGQRIEGIGEVSGIEEVVIFHAGTRREGANYYTNGGRVLGVAARGVDLKTAARVSYDTCSRLRFEGAHFRRDIGLPAGRLRTAGG